MKLRWIALTFVAAVMPATGTRIQTHTQCGLYYGPGASGSGSDWQQGPLHCSASLDGFTVSADASGHDRFFPYLYEAFASTQTFANVIVEEGFPSWVANASLSMTASLGTSGPVRDGWLNWQLMFGLSYYTRGSTTMRVVAGPYFWESCIEVPCDLQWHTGWLPVTLGQPLDVQLTGYSEAFGPNDYGTDVRLKFSLYEADRVTPVAMFDPFAVPEPVGMGAVGVLTMVLLRLSGVHLSARSRAHRPFRR